MPQMSPYNWLTLFFLFNMIMMFIISHIHFSFMINNKPNLSFYKLNSFKLMW